MKVFAIAGGGGSAMDDYLFHEVVKKENPRVCYLPTAGGDDFDDIQNFWMGYQGRCKRLSILSLFNRTVNDLYAALTGCDLLFAGGGNTVNLLAVWRAHGFDEVVRKLGEEGTVLAGISAGALCWFDGGLTDSYGPGYNPLTNGLGILPHQFCPHLNHRGREVRFREYAKSVGRSHYGAEDNVGLHFEDGDLVRAVSTVRGSRAVQIEDGKVRRIPTTLLP